jgi:hypothetical protein
MLSYINTAQDTADTQGGGGYARVALLTPGLPKAILDDEEHASILLAVAHNQHGMVAHLPPAARQRVVDDSARVRAEESRVGEELCNDRAIFQSIFNVVYVRAVFLLVVLVKARESLDTFLSVSAEIFALLVFAFVRVSSLNKYAIVPHEVESARDVTTEAAVIAVFEACAIDDLLLRKRFLSLILVIDDEVKLE